MLTNYTVTWCCCDATLWVTVRVFVEDAVSRLLFLLNYNCNFKNKWPFTAFVCNSAQLARISPPRTLLMVLSDPRDQAVSVPSRRFPSSPQKPPPAKRITMAVESRQLRLIDGTDSVNPDIFRPLENPDVFGSFHPTPLRQRTTNENKCATHLL